MHVSFQNARRFKYKCEYVKYVYQVITHITYHMNCISWTGTHKSWCSLFQLYMLFRQHLKFFKRLRSTCFLNVWVHLLLHSMLYNSCLNLALLQFKINIIIIQYLIARKHIDQSISTASRQRDEVWRSIKPIKQCISLFSRMPNGGLALNIHNFISITRDALSIGCISSKIHVLSETLPRPHHHPRRPFCKRNAVTRQYAQLLGYKT